MLDTIRERGSVVCGGRTDLAGFGYLDENGRNVGLDADLVSRRSGGGAR